MSLVETFRDHSRTLEAGASATSTIHHAGDRGAEREDILQDFLAPLLPEKIAIGTGEIRATNGSWSKQGDLILYDKINCPRLFVGKSSQIFPIESVASVIEIKSTLDTAKMKEASENIAAAKRLEKTGNALPVTLPGAIQMRTITPLFGCVFAYKIGLKADTFKQKWAEIQLALPVEQRVNMLCVLNQFVICHIDYNFHLWDNMDDNLINAVLSYNFGKDSLMAFVLLLSRVLGTYAFGAPNLFKYYMNDEEINTTFDWFQMRP